MFTKNHLFERIFLREHKDRTAKYTIQIKNLGNITIIILVVTTVLLWIAFPPPPYPDNNWGRDYARQHAGETIGSVILVLMSCSLFLAACGTSSVDSNFPTGKFVLPDSESEESISVKMEPGLPFFSGKLLLKEPITFRVTFIRRKPILRQHALLPQPINTHLTEPISNLNLLVRMAVRTDENPWMV